MILKRVCVFCGSKNGADPRHCVAAHAVGQTIAAAGLELVYGGGSVGMMGTVANAVLAAGGQVIGVIPRHLATVELLHPGVQDMRIVAGMHPRKALMEELSDAFIVLPGGFGTFEELFEIITWAQLGLHGKPVGLLNVAGYYDLLLQFLENSVTAGFVKPQNLELLLVDENPVELLNRIRSFRGRSITPAMRREES